MKRSKNRQSRQHKKLRIAGYVRVSSVRQATEGDSLVAQQNEIEHEIEARKRRGLWEVESLELYVDAGKSAKDQNRPQLQRLKRDIAAGRIDVVICFKLDRITRSITDFVDLWRLFREHGVDVVSLRENFDTSTATGEAMVQLVIVFAQLERKMTAERTFSIMRDRVDRGVSNGLAPMGYRHGADGRLEVDLDEAPIVRLIYDRFEHSGSAGAVVSELADRGIMQPKRTTVSGKVRGGRPFQKQQVLRILRNPAYVGTIEWGEARREKSHPSIISDEQFARVSRRLEETVRRRSNFRSSGIRTYTLSGLLRCSCGSHLVGASYPGRSNTYRYYVCTRQQHEGTGASCQAPRIPADDLERAVLKRLVDIGNRDEARQAIIDAAAIMVTGRRGELDSQAADLRQRILSNKSERSKLLEVLKVGGASAFLSVKDELERLEEEADRLEHSLAAIALEQEPLEQQEAAARTFLESWGGIGDIFAAAEPEELRAILQHFVEVIEFRSVDPGSRQGEYAIRMFPEVDASFGQDDPPAPPGGDDTGSGAKRKKPAPNSGRGGGTGGSLTGGGPVCTNEEKAPRVGFEPTTYRLTAGRSTVELSGNEPARNDPPDDL